MICRTNQAVSIVAPVYYADLGTRLSFFGLASLTADAVNFLVLPQSVAMQDIGLMRTPAMTEHLISHLETLRHPKSAERPTRPGIAF